MHIVPPVSKVMQKCSGAEQLIKKVERVEFELQ
jgi:hypothetical protein